MSEFIGQIRRTDLGLYFEVEGMGGSDKSLLRCIFPTRKINEVYLLQESTVRESTVFVANLADVDSQDDGGGHDR